MKRERTFLSVVLSTFVRKKGKRCAHTMFVSMSSAGMPKPFSNPSTADMEVMSPAGSPPIPSATTISRPRQAAHAVLSPPGALSGRGSAWMTHRSASCLLVSSFSPFLIASCPHRSHRQARYIRTPLSAVRTAAIAAARNARPRDWHNIRLAEGSLVVLSPSDDGGHRRDKGHQPACAHPPPLIGTRVWSPNWSAGLLSLCPARVPVRAQGHALCSP